MILFLSNLPTLVGDGYTRARLFLVIGLQLLLIRSLWEARCKGLAHIMGTGTGEGWVVDEATVVEGDSQA